MYINHVIFLLYSTPVLCQYAFNPVLGPDVTFGDHNDRFDLSSMVNQNYFRSRDPIDYRRKHTPKTKRKSLRPRIDLNNFALRDHIPLSKRERKKLAKKIKKDTERKVNEIANEILLRISSARRVGDDYVVQDNKESDEGVFKRILGGFRNKPLRRSGAPNHSYGRSMPELFNYAFPIDMNIQGYLVAPEN